MNVWDLLGRIVAPARCAACHEVLEREAIFCAPCAASVERRPHGCGARCGNDMALFAYGGALAQAITRFKYEDRAELARPLGALMCRALQADAWRDVDLIVPIPLARARLVSRGYNTSALLAARVARHLGTRWTSRALVRVRETRPQVELDRAERLKNVQHAFVARPVHVQAKRCLLLDDVRTTGATLADAARALREAGASQVMEITLAGAD